MRAAIFEKSGKPLHIQKLKRPHPKEHEVLLKVRACGVCRTDLHIFRGELKEPKTPLVMGHQIVGEIQELGSQVKDFKKGDIVGVPWLGKSCEACSYCTSKRENLCDEALYTGYQIDGGFAEYTLADSRYIFSIPEGYSDIEAAPLLCAGLIGYRSYKLCKDAKKIGFYGFGSAAHILLQLALYDEKEVYVFTKPADFKGQEKAITMGASWAGDSETAPPTLLDAAIIFAPVGALIPTALKALSKGGIVVSAGIHMSDIPSFPYSLLWGERTVQSIANLTRRDGEEFLQLAPKVPIKTDVTAYPLDKINQAFEDLEDGKITGSAVIVL